MQPSAQQLYKQCKTAHETIYRQISSLRHEIDKCNNYVELCDYALAVNESHELIEDSKRELYKLRELVVKKVCELWLTEMLRPNSSKERSIRTDYVCATPNIKQAPDIPNAKTDPAGHKKLMDYLGIDISNWARKENGELDEAVKIHWPAFINLVTERLAKGLPAPAGIDTTRMLPVYKLTLRKKKEVDAVI